MRQVYALRASRRLSTLYHRAKLQLTLLQLKSSRKDFAPATTRLVFALIVGSIGQLVIRTQVVRTRNAPTVGHML